MITMTAEADIHTATVITNTTTNIVTGDDDSTTDRMFNYPLGANPLSYHTSAKAFPETLARCTTCVLYLGVNEIIADMNDGGVHVFLF
jgi:hypothetical protein